MDVYNVFWGLGQIFIQKLNCNKQKSHDWSISWVSAKFRKIKNFTSEGFLWMYTLGFGIWAKFLFQILSVKSKSPTRGQFYGFC